MGKKSIRRATRRHSRTATVLACAALALAGMLAALHLRPTRCAMCGRLSPRFRTVRLVRGWHLFLPNVHLEAGRPVLCRGCFRAILMDSPAKDDVSRRTLAKYLTDPRAAQPVLDALRQPIAAPQAPESAPDPPPDAEE